MAKKVKFVVKGRTAKGWEDFKSFTSVKNAEEWMVSFIYEHNYSPYDFTIVRR